MKYQTLNCFNVTPGGARPFVSHNRSYLMNINDTIIWIQMICILNMNNYVCLMSHPLEYVEQLNDVASVMYGDRYRCLCFFFIFFIAFVLFK